MLQDMAGLVTQDSHAFANGPAFHLENFFSLETHQTGMGEKERNGDARRVVRTEPFVREPGMRPDRQLPPLQFAMQVAQAVFEPGALDADLEVLQAKFQQFLVGQRGPGKAARHDAETRRWVAGAYAVMAGGGRQLGPDAARRARRCGPAGLAKMPKSRGKG